MYDMCTKVEWYLGNDKTQQPLLGEVSLYAWSQVLQVSTQLLRFILITTHIFFFWSNPILPKWVSLL